MKYINKLITFLVLFVPLITQAAQIDATKLTLPYALPFALVLVGIATIPLFAAGFWHHHYGKFALFCALLIIVPLLFLYGSIATVSILAHVAFVEYLPFILLLTALYVVSGGIFFPIPIEGTPRNNGLILLIGAVLASLMGTTGAAMLLIRPLIRANTGRQFKTHTFVFFIFIVANVGGSLTPLGDPPLFLGFLKGVSFFWLIQHMWLQVLVTLVLLLIIYYALDLYFYSKEAKLSKSNIEIEDKAFTHIQADNKMVVGVINFIFLLIVCGLVLLSGAWKSSMQWHFHGVDFTLPNIVRDVGLIVVIFLSLKFTPVLARIGNEFNWSAMVEVAKLFAAIFITIMPVMAMLQLGADGPFAHLLVMMQDSSGEPKNQMYFWVTGVLSGFLDNAPTYLVAFNMAGGDAVHLMGDLSGTLIAISMGSVFMGALSYIGNAPNLMVRSVVVSHGISMPSFISYMLWSFGCLIPVFVLISYVFI